MAYEHIFLKGSLKETAEKKYAEWYRLAYYDKETQIWLWDREITRKYKRTETFKEFQEFIERYKFLKKGINWLSDPKLPGVYKAKLAEGFKHQDIMNNLKMYKIHLESFTWKKPTMPWTYLNRNAFKEKWELDKNYSANKWRRDMLENQWVPKHCAEPIEQEADKWQKNYPDKELTTHIYQNIINKYYIPANEKNF